MPHMTQAYPFEWKIIGFASRLSAQLAGGQGYHSFLMVLSAEGAVQTLHFESPADSWHQLTDRMDRAGTSYLFYDPFDAPEYIWLSWRHVDRSTMERLIGEQFQDADFIKLQHATSRAPDLKPPGAYPPSWGVMF
jgi:hypothetical protein